MRASVVLFIAVAVLEGSCSQMANLPSLTPDASEEKGCASAPAGAGAARAKHVVCDDELAKGALAMGRAGDVMMENARLRVILRAGAESATTIGAPGGGILDVTLAGRPEGDRAKELIPMINFHGLLPDELVVVQAAGAEAKVRASFTPKPIGLFEAVFPLGGQKPEVRGVVEYSLKADEPVIGVTVCALPSGSDDPVKASLGMAVLLGGAMEVLAPGVGVLAGDMATGDSRAIYLESQEIAYAVELGGVDSSILHAGTVTLMTAKARVAFTRGALACTRARVAVAPTAAEAAAALAAAGAGTFEVAVPAGGRAEILDAMGRPVLRSREQGGKVLAAVEGSGYTARVARAGGAWGDASAPPATGTLVIAAGVNGEPGAPVRVTVEGIDDKTLEARLVVAGAEGRWTGPAGRYRVTASRGLEYTLVAQDVSLTANGEAHAGAQLDHVVSTVGYVSTDFHLHTELSTDSVHPLGDAVRQMAGEGVEVLASTDHDFVSDFAAVAAASGVGDWIVAVPGEEVSTTKLGHYAGYPLKRDLARAGAGALPWFVQSPAQIFQGLRARGDDVVVQVNHPRLRGTGVFDQIGLDPVTGKTSGSAEAAGLLAGTDLSDLSFEAIEVWNGYTRGDNEKVFADFLALRAGGRRYVMVGNSDSHRPDLPPGAPRSFVRVPDDARGKATWADVRKGLRGGDVSVGAGLFVEASAGGVRPGGLAAAAAGMTTLHVKVQGPPWADCTRLRVYRGTEVVVDRPIATPRDQAIRLEEDIAVATPADTFLVVRADGMAAADPIFPWPPFAVSNPLQVDADGDGK